MSPFSATAEKCDYMPMISATSDCGAINLELEIIIVYLPVKLLSRHTAIARIPSGGLGNSKIGVFEPP